MCKILDYGKFRFQEQKRKRETKKNQVIQEIKELVFRPGTEENDYQVKLRKIKEFLAEGNKAKINLRFKGREVTHMDIGQEMLTRLVNDTADFAKVDFRSTKVEGRFLVLILSPGGKGAKKADAPAASTPTA